MIVGVGLQAKLRKGIPPLPKHILRGRLKCATRGLAIQTPEEKEKLELFLEEELRRFKDVHGIIDRVQHEIRLQNTTPIKQKYWPRNSAMQTIINEEVRKMLTDDVIEPSYSP